jgi:hypothetical protein
MNVGWFWAWLDAAWWAAGVVGADGAASAAVPPAVAAIATAKVIPRPNVVKRRFQLMRYQLFLGWPVGCGLPAHDYVAGDGNLVTS